MARVSTYLNFMGTTGPAFEFYKHVFGTEYVSPPMTLGDAPPQPGMPELPDDVKKMIMNVQLEILAGHVLMGTDMVEMFGHQLNAGNNVSINLEPDSRAENQRLFDALSEGGSDIQPLADMFWGAQFGTCVDKFGTRWMFNCYEPA